MDPLDRLADPAADLLSRVDDVLADAGAPDEHRIWPLLRRLEMLPGDVLTSVTALRAAPMESAAGRLPSWSRAYQEAGTALTGTGWEGAGAQAYELVRHDLRGHLAGGRDSLTGRLEATASYLRAVADWVATSRLALARTLADVLMSAEAVTMVSGSVRGPAAAEIGARVLSVGVEVADGADELLRQWDPHLAPVEFRPSAVPAERFDGVTRIAL